MSVYDLCVNPQDPLLIRGWDLSKHALLPELFAVITDICDGSQVTGLITSMSVNMGSQWDSKMSQDNIDDKIPWSAILQTGGLGQVVDLDIIKAFKGRTHFTKDQTRQIWVGTSPIAIEMELEFVAHENPLQEVSGAVALLQRMSLPTIKESLVDSYQTVINETINSIRSGQTPDLATLNTILGYIPTEITVSVFDDLFDSKYLITDVSYSDSEMLRGSQKGEDTKSNLKQSVSVSFISTTSLNKQDVIVH